MPRPHVPGPLALGRKGGSAGAKGIENCPLWAETGTGRALSHSALWAQLLLPGGSCLLPKPSPGSAACSSTRFLVPPCLPDWKVLLTCRGKQGTPNACLFPKLEPTLNGDPRAAGRHRRSDSDSLPSGSPSPSLNLALCVQLPLSSLRNACCIE